MRIAITTIGKFESDSIIVSFQRIQVGRIQTYRAGDALLSIRDLNNLGESAGFCQRLICRQSFSKYSFHCYLAIVKDMT